MRRILFIILLSAAMSWKATVSWGDEGEVRAGFERILDLWRDGDFAALYAHTTGGRMTRESFAKRMAASPLRPTCCWDKLQEVTVTMHSSASATLTGTVSLESPAGTETRTKRFPLKKEGAIWKVPMGELISLAAEGGKAKRKGVRKR